ncbi:MAG: response regulator [Thaumarchaeota archaeon]|nr:response regulator [Nitrososphaerota archaeon]
MTDTHSGDNFVSSGLKIAVVDDEEDLALVYRVIFRKLGYSPPSIFRDGTSIVKALARDHGSFDIIVMDYRMPEMNGIEAAKIIKKYRQDTKIILVTAFDSVKQEALAAGFTFLSKPFSIEQLALCLESVKATGY